MWWPPTKDRKKTDFSGMYWPAKVVKHTSEGYEVQYDNGDREMVLSENVSPFTPPVKFGEEGCALQVGCIRCGLSRCLRPRNWRQSELTLVKLCSVDSPLAKQLGTCSS